MKFNISKTDEINLNNTNDINTLGEFLRDEFFDQSNGYSSLSFVKKINR